MKHILVFISILSFGILQACAGDDSSSSNSDAYTDTDTGTDPDTDADTEPVGFAPCPTDGNDCKVMPVGDSITVGLRSSDGGSYRTQLFRNAVADGKKLTFVGRASGGPNDVNGVPFPKNHEGYSGWFVDQWHADAAEPALNANMPHIITMMLGTNDVHQLDNPRGGDGTETAAELSSLIDFITDRAQDTLVAVALITPADGTYQYAQSLIADYNTKIPPVVDEKIAAGKHVILVDLFTDFPANSLADGLHPNDNGYNFMGDQWYEAIKDYLP